MEAPDKLSLARAETGEEEAKMKIETRMQKALELIESAGTILKMRFNGKKPKTTCPKI